MSRITDQIRRSRGDLPPHGAERDGTNSEGYEAFILTEGFPQMAFSVVTRHGDRHIFFYHNVDNLDLKEIDDDYQRVRFTHRGKAVTMRGRGLHRMIDGFMDHTLQAAYEHHPDIYPQAEDDEELIDRLEITDLNLSKKEAGG